MKMFLISDNADTYNGMRLVGVEGVIVHEREELKAAMDQALTDPEIGILLLMERFGKEFPDMIDDVRLHRKVPLDCGDPGPSRYRACSGFYYVLCE